MIRDKSSGAIIVDRHIGSEAAPYARPLLIEEQKMPDTVKLEESLKNLARSLVGKASSNTLWRQKHAVNLIPSEQTMSLLVRLLTIADPSGRYAEHRRVKALGDTEVYYYQGTKFIAEVELEIIEGIKEFLDCSEE
jgi:aminomethyltransferase